MDFEEQLKLLNEDLNVLRNKLELKNQLLESREKATKKLEEEKEVLKFELKEEKKNFNVSLEAGEINLFKNPQKFPDKNKNPDNFCGQKF